MAVISNDLKRAKRLERLERTDLRFAGPDRSYSATNAALVFLMFHKRSGFESSRLLDTGLVSQYVAAMEVIRDCFESSVRLTNERLAHILEHTEFAGMEGELKVVLQDPSEVRLSQVDDDVKLFYKFYPRTQVGGKWLS